MIPYFDDLSEDPIGGVLCFLSVRGLDVARFPSKVFNVEARRFVAWTGVAHCGGRCRTCCGGWAAGCRRRSSPLCTKCWSHVSVRRIRESAAFWRLS